MKWEESAEKALKKVPFFVRKKVRSRVESQVESEGKTVVTEADLQAARERFLNKMEEEVRGYQLDACFAGSGCPHQVGDVNTLMKKIEAKLEAAKLHSFLKANVDGPLKFHHEFRVSISGCPNACSQPQIRDIGITAVDIPKITSDTCVGCNGCRQVCKEGAVHFDDGSDKPRIDMGACVFCGACIKECNSGTIVSGKAGYRIMLGGRLGRHPRLAVPLPGIYSMDGVIKIVAECLEFYKSRSKGGARFAKIISDRDIEKMGKRFKKYRT